MVLGTSAGNSGIEIVLMCCGSSLVDPEGLPRVMDCGDGIRARPAIMPCSSKVEAYQILQILAEGADGVNLVTCTEKKCRFLVGNVRARKRVDYTRKILDDIGMGAKRLGIDSGGSLTVEDLKKFARKRAEAIAALGPSPMKGDG